MWHSSKVNVAPLISLLVSGLRTQEQFEEGPLRKVKPASERKRKRQRTEESAGSDSDVIG